jgi:hypothetical protein
MESAFVAFIEGLSFVALIVAGVSLLVAAARQVISRKQNHPLRAGLLNIVELNYGALLITALLLLKIALQVYTLLEPLLLGLLVLLIANSIEAVTLNRRLGKRNAHDSVEAYEAAISCGRLFWPDFVEHDGCILFANFNQESYEGFMKQTGGNKKAVEAVMNHEHLSDLFPNNEPTERQVIYLGRLLKDIWQTKLKRDFPAQQISVEFYEQDCKYPEDFQITFYQPSNDQSKN